MEPLLKTPSIISEETLESFKKFGHVALIGPTESGKTYRFKIFCCDQKFNCKEYDEFIYVGPPKQLEEISKAWAANLYLTTGSFEKDNMRYFKLEEIEQAILYCTAIENNHSKLCFLDDALIVNPQTNKRIATWIHQAKNYNTTAVISVHEAFGSKDEKMVRTACKYYVGLNLGPETISKLIQQPKDSYIIKQLESKKQSPEKNVFIYDKNTQLCYKNDYKVFNNIN